MKVDTIAGDAAGNYTIVRVHRDDACGNSTFKVRRSPRRHDSPDPSIPAEFTGALDELILTMPRHRQLR